MPTLLVIPARIGSTRLLRKPLQLLAGFPLVVRVVERARQVPGIDRIVVATDSEEVVAAVRPTGVEVAITSPDHPSGSDRVAEVAMRADMTSYDVIINLQGDEPFMPGEAITGSVNMVRSGFDIGTAAAPLDPSLRNEPHLVKVVSNSLGEARYFSRSAIPFLRDPVDLPQAQWWQHLGVYAWTRETLFKVTSLPPSPLEQTEKLEQLRALEAGFTIGVAQLNQPVPAGIDTAADLAAAEALWQQTLKEFR